MANDSLTGADVDETSLDLECPASTMPAGDVCFAPVQSAATWEGASDDCASQFLRLPSDGEARLVHAELGPPSTFRGLWTEDQADGGSAMVSRMLSNGSTDGFGVAKSGAIAYVCVRAPLR